MNSVVVRGRYGASLQAADKPDRDAAEKQIDSGIQEDFVQKFAGRSCREQLRPPIPLVVLDCFHRHLGDVSFHLAAGGRTGVGFARRVSPLRVGRGAGRSMFGHGGCG